MRDQWNAKRQEIRLDCARRGISIHKQGKAYRLIGKQIDLMVADLTWVNTYDLNVRNLTELRAKPV